MLGADTLRNFCLLRSESVRGQIDGVIPSDIAGQDELYESGLADDVLIDASSVWLPDMGEIADLKD